LREQYHLLVYTDGASRGNPGPAAIGYSIYDSSGELVEQDARTIGRHTNNEAEYQALIWAIERAKAHARGPVKFHSDSELMVHQVNGVYKASNERMRNLLAMVHKETEGIGGFKMVYAPRETPKIQIVDGLVNEALDNG
jgi:ribonuclease HI